MALTDFQFFSFFYSFFFSFFHSGFGIFTYKDVAKDEFILEYEEEFISSEVAEPKEINYDKNMGNFLHFFEKINWQVIS